MNMQDKELDELFRGKLHDFESVPAADVWNRITGELDGTSPRRRTTVPMLRIAATVLIVLSAGLFFYRQQNAVPQSAVKNPGIAAILPKIKGNNIARPASPVMVRHEGGALTAAQPVLALPAPRLPLASAAKNKSAAKTSRNMRQNLPPDDENAHEKDMQQETLAGVNKLNLDVSKPVVPDMKLSTVSPADVQSTPAANNTGNTAVIAQNITKPSKKHGIRSFGDIVNAVVAKVDKRADKVIEFSDADDEESNITGVNLGLLKVKKEK